MEKNKLYVATCLFLLSFFSTASYADNFEANLESAWADTPRGKFECRNDKSTNYLEELKLGGKLIYRGPGDNYPEENITPSIVNGIINYDPSCPDILANKNGYLLIVRSTQPPHYGMAGYAIINFNDPILPIYELGTSQGPKDEKINSGNRFQWTSSSLTLNYFGYLLSEYAGDGKAKPKSHQTRFEFSSKKITQVK